MKLKSYRVTNFRSVDDSGIIETENVTALIGVNESGKSNLLLPLWKLNPASDGELDPIADFPRARYTEIRAAKEKPTYINAIFELQPNEIKELRALTFAGEEEVRLVSISAKLSGDLRYVSFPETKSSRPIPKIAMATLTTESLAKLTAKAAEEPAMNEEAAALKTALETADAALTKMKENLSPAQVVELVELFEDADVFDETDTGPFSVWAKSFFNRLYELHGLANATITDSAKARSFAVKHLPKFVYYSNYGNLDSEIYLPTVIANMKRTDLGPIAQAKTRTLKVLFDFVKLKPEEILELGKPILHAAPTDAQIKDSAKKKEEREILLQSAAVTLTKKFGEWWKQGDYVFKFQADGDHFKIWVSDSKRPEPIQLEYRSTGLQWFLSFFLVFLVESGDAHKDAILLLDEPGLTLHPLGQRDLSLFFENLSKTNQIVFSTHSPFMVESEHLDRVRAVYSDDNGKTVATPDLRSASPKSLQAKSVYAAHAALGLSVSDVILQGCQMVIVEGSSDQHYLNMLKNHLVGIGAIKPSREILFIPGGGTKAIKTVASIMSAKDGLPYVLVDSDIAGAKTAEQLRAELYTGDKTKVVTVKDLCGLDQAEVEDLIPTDLISKVFARMFRGEEEEFDDVVDPKRPIIPQMMEFARNNERELHSGWKVDLARAVKKKASADADALKDTKKQKAWEKLFSAVIGDEAES